MSNPLISVIIPVYNAEEFLESSLRSVMDQTYKNLEIICINDGSTDNSLSILQRMKGEDKRIRVISDVNHGAGAARNTGMDHATGDFIFFFDSDDLLKKKMMEILVKTALKNDTDIVLFGYQKFSGSKKVHTDFSAKVLKVPMNRVISPDQVSDRLFQADHGMPWNKFYKTQFLRSLGIRFQELKNTNDEYFSRLSTVMAKRILFLDKILIYYRVENKNSLRGNAGKNILDCTYALRAIHDELKKRNLFDTYLKSYKKLAGYIVMLKLAAIDDPDAFYLLADEVSERIIYSCEIDEEYLEEQYKSAYRALRVYDIPRAETEFAFLKKGGHVKEKRWGFF